MNRKTAIRTFAATLLLALGAGAASAAAPVAAPAPAQPPAARPEPLPSYEALDANRDGIVTLPEIDVYSRPLAREVQHCDHDNDRTMTREEHAACERHPMPAHHPGAHPAHWKHHHPHKDDPATKDTGAASQQ
ncbi:MAG: hypothetical protein LW860_02815 [Xanthomonadaceae bacterium]|jgi:hypothetical protein|nr:hypothetical protein [Xanthomonadaceae bacterium]